MRRLIAISAGFGFALLGPATAHAVPTDPSGFGQHVVTCAQQAGFNGTHNPGVHHGASGWDGMACQP